MYEKVFIVETENFLDYLDHHEYKYKYRPTTKYIEIPLIYSKEFNNILNIIHYYSTESLYKTYTVLNTIEHIQDEFIFCFNTDYLPIPKNNDIIYITTGAILTSSKALPHYLYHLYEDIIRVFLPHTHQTNITIESNGNEYIVSLDHFINTLKIETKVNNSYKIENSTIKFKNKHNLPVLIHIRNSETKNETYHLYMEFFIDIATLYDILYTTNILTRTPHCMYMVKELNGLSNNYSYIIVDNNVLKIIRGRDITKINIENYFIAGDD